YVEPWCASSSAHGRLPNGPLAGCAGGSSTTSQLLSLGILSQSKGRKRFARSPPGTFLVPTSRLPSACFSCRFLRHASAGRHPMLWSPLDHGVVPVASLAPIQTATPPQRRSIDRPSLRSFVIA